MKIKLKKVGIVLTTLIGIGSIGITIPFLVSCSNSNPSLEQPTKPSDPNIIVDETNTYVFNKTTNTLLGLTDDFMNKYWLKPNPDVGINLIIPNQIQGYDVLKLNNGYFNFLSKLKYKTKINKIVFPNSIKTIDEQLYTAANFNNDNYIINEIYIPDSVEYICESAFSGIMAKKIRLPENDKYTVIEYEAFAYNSFWTEIIIPDNIVRIEERAFIGSLIARESIKNIKLSDNLEYIGKHAFASTIKFAINEPINYSEGITLHIPQSVKKIDSFAFGECNKITNINITSNTNYIGWNAFWKTGLSQVNILDGVFYDQGCFSELSNLKSIVVDNNYTFNFNPNNPKEFIEQPNLKGPFAWYGKNEWGNYGWYLKEFKPEIIIAPAILGSNESGWYNGFYWLGIQRSSWVRWCEYNNYQGPSIFP